MEIGKILLTNNDCYKKGAKMTPKGIVVHSTGANNTTIKRYVQPDDGIIGLNKNGNDWNHPGVSKCVHAFIGKDKNGSIKVYQTLPFDMKPWGCGKGSKGSYNNSHIQFEMCEDDLKNEQYFNEIMTNGIDFCVLICKQYGLTVDSIVSHHEAHVLGYASDHGDPDHWLKKFGKDMNWFRAEVSKKLGNVVPEQNDVPFKVKITCDSLNVRMGPGINYDVVGCIVKDKSLVEKNPNYYYPCGTYTIVEDKNGWGRLKSGAGWISLNTKYSTRV